MSKKKLFEEYVERRKKDREERFKQIAPDIIDLVNKEFNASNRRQNREKYTQNCADVFDLYELTNKELRKIAKYIGIPYYYRMNKHDIIGKIIGYITPP